MKKALIKKVFLLQVVYTAFIDVIKLGAWNWSIQFVFFIHFSVSEFAKKTGDFRSLSAVDLRVLGLTYQLEKEFCDAEHIKDEPCKKVGHNILCVWKSQLEEFSRMRVYVVYFLCFWKQSPKGVFQNEVSYIFLPPFLPTLVSAIHLVPATLTGFGIFSCSAFSKPFKAWSLLKRF